MKKEPMQKIKKNMYRLWDTHIETQKAHKTKLETVVHTQKICLVKTIKMPRQSIMRQKSSKNVTELVLSWPSTAGL